MSPKTRKTLNLKPARLSRRIKKALQVKDFDESAAQRLEAQIPKLAKNATTLAYRRALTSGRSVLIAEAGAVVEVLPNGMRRTVKQIAPGVKMSKGQIIKIK